MTNSIITIGREFGSGGREIGEKLSKEFDIPFYDKELIALASKQSGLSQEILEHYDEIQTSSLIYTLAMGSYPYSDGARLYMDMPLYQQIFMAQFDTIENLAKQGPCVIVGRCADYVLRKNKNVINIFVSADMPFKIERVSKIYNLDEKKAMETIIKTDKKRANYYRYYTEQKWGLVCNYDLCIKSSKIGIDNTVKAIADYVRNNNI